MTDTVRSLTALQALLADNVTHDISPQDQRDAIYSALGVVPYVAKSTSYTATENDELIGVTTSTSTITITLPAVATTRVGKVYTIRKVDSGTGHVIVDGNSAEQIDADTTKILLNQYASITIVNNGSAWSVVASYGVVSGLTFVATASVTVADTTNETTLIGSGIGNLTLPANFYRVGKVLRIKAAGMVSNTGTPNLTITAKHGATVTGSTGGVATEVGLSNTGWTCEVIHVCRTVGGSGTVMSQGVFNYGANTQVVMANSGAITIDTTTTQALNLTATWGTQSASNTISCHEFLIEILR